MIFATTLSTLSIISGFRNMEMSPSGPVDWQENEFANFTC